MAAAGGARAAREDRANLVTFSKWTPRANSISVPNIPTESAVDKRSPRAAILPRPIPSTSLDPRLRPVAFQVHAHLTLDELEPDFLVRVLDDLQCNLSSRPIGGEPVSRVAAIPKTWRTKGNRRRGFFDKRRGGVPVLNAGKDRL
jgi:hypothetical protein